MDKSTKKVFYVSSIIVTVLSIFVLTSAIWNRQKQTQSSLAQLTTPTPTPITAEDDDHLIDIDLSDAGSPEDNTILSYGYRIPSFELEAQIYNLAPVYVAAYQEVNGEFELIGFSELIIDSGLY